MAYCRKCGYQIQDDAVYCGKCGSEQNASAPQQPVQYIDTTPTIQQVKASADNSVKCADDTNLYFGYSNRMVTTNVICGVLGLVFVVIGVIFCNHKIGGLEDYRWLSDEIERLVLFRNVFIFLGLIVLVNFWRAFMVSKNYLRITGNVINGVCYNGIANGTVYSLDISRVRNVTMKGRNALVILADADKKYVFFLDDPNRAATIIRSKFYK